MRRMDTSSIGTTEKQLMSMEAKMKKEERSLFGRDTMELTKNGRLSILTKPTQFKPRVLTKILDSMSTDHSTSDLE